jgi:MFS family permease
VPELIVKDYALDIYWSGVILGSSEIFSSILCYFIVDHFERKQVIYLAQLLGIVVTLPIFIFASCGSSVEECGVLSSVMQIVGLFLFRFFITVGYNFFYMAQYEMFPTQIRSIALQVTAVFSLLTFVASPLIQAFF